MYHWYDYRKSTQNILLKKQKQNLKTYSEFSYIYCKKIVYFQLPEVLYLTNTNSILTIKIPENLKFVKVIERAVYLVLS